MAVDQVLLESAPRLGRPVLRLYAWTEAAATFGYFQRFSEVERVTPLRPLVRRPTGGGVVPHAADWTYSLIFPPTAAWYEIKALESYQRLHLWIQAAFERIGLQTVLSASSPKGPPGQCFVGSVRFDLLWHGQKIAGAAQRRTRQGLLIQGSIQPPSHLSRTDWQQAFIEIAREQWAVNWVPFLLDPGLEARIGEEAARKYACSEYNRQR